MHIVSKMKRESLVFILIVAGIFVVLNILAVKIFFRWDLTANDAHSLSAGSIRLMENLKDRLTVKAYFTEDLPPPFNSHLRYVKDILDEYRVHAGGKMRVDIIDPTGDEVLEKEAQQFGIQKVGHRVIDRDQSEVKLGYRGLAFTYGAKTEAISAIQSTVGLEYEITSVLKQLVGEKKNVGVLVGHGEPNIKPTQQQLQQAQMMKQQPPQGALSILRNTLPQFTFTEVDLKKGDKGVPDDVDLLLIAGTTEEIPEREAYMIDQYLMKGGSVAVFVDGVRVEMNESQYRGVPPSFDAKLNKSGLRDLLLAWGVKLGSDLVMDARSGMFPTQCPPIPMAIPRRYPAWPVAVELPTEHPATLRLASLTLPWTTSVELTEQVTKPDSGIEAVVLASTSDQSWRLTSDFEVNPCKISQPPGFEGSIPMAVALSGKFKSAWADKEAPPPRIRVENEDTGAEDADSPEEEKGDEADAKLDVSSSEGRLLVVGSSYVPTDSIISYLRRMERGKVSNMVFLANSLDWLVQDDDLIAVRAKGVEVPPLKTLEDGVRNTVKYGLIIGIPLLFILFGVIRWRIRLARFAKLKME